MQCSNKSNHVKSSTIFDQARTFSERSNAKKTARAYVSDSDSDSDSDIESRKKVEWSVRNSILDLAGIHSRFQKTAYTSGFWRQKMRTMHGIFDVNNDGVISFDDFNILADKFGSNDAAK